MKILALYPFLPFPPVTGGKIRGCSVLEILSRRHEVTLASLVAEGDDPAQFDTWENLQFFFDKPVVIYPDPPAAISKLGVLLRNLQPQSACGMPHWLERFDSAAMWNHLASLDMSSFLVIHVRHISMTRYAIALKRQNPYLRLVVDLDDVPSMVLWRNLCRLAGERDYRALPWHLREFVRMSIVEGSLLRSFDSVWICSHIDYKRIARRVGANRTLVVPNVVNTRSLDQTQDGIRRLSLLFIGNFRYGPNRQGADFFVNRVWPTIRSEVSGAQLWLVGDGVDEEMQGWNGTEGILVTGAVADVRPYLQSATASVAPLWYGSGTRVKILEALASGLPVVTTSIGVEGIEAEDGVHLLIGDTNIDFAQHCIRLLTDSELRQRLTNSGRSLVEEKYSLPVMSRIVADCYTTIAEAQGDD